MGIPGSKAVYVSLVILGLLGGALMLVAGKLPVLDFLAGPLEVPTQPYALDDPVERSRVADGVLDARLPELPSFRRRAQGVELATVQLDVEPDQPGFNSELRIYRPSGQHATGALGCVLVGPAGGTGITGPVVDSAVDEDECLPYVEAGFIVVAFRQDGERPSENATMMENIRAARKFLAAQAGLVNARNALEFVLARMPEVDARRIYVAGHSSAAALSLLFAEHESRLAGCIAYAPVTNIVQRLSDSPGTTHRMTNEERELFAQISPATHARKLTCPVFLFHSSHDRVVPAVQSTGLAAQLEQLGKPVTLLTVRGSDHHGDMIREGIPAGIAWLQDLEHPELAEQRRAERAAAKARRTASSSPVDRTEANRRALASNCTAWTNAAEAAIRRLERIDDGKTLGQRTSIQVNAALSRLAQHKQTVLHHARALPVRDEQGPIHLLPAETRDRLETLNRKLAGELQRLSNLNSRELKRSGVLVNVRRGLLPDSFMKGTSPTPQELAAEVELEAEYHEMQFSMGTDIRDFRNEAKWAIAFGRWPDAVKLLQADLLVADDEALLAAVKWSPALARPAERIQWAFGAQLEGIAGAGPPNLRPVPQTPKTRSTSDDWRIGDQLKALTGDIGLWLAEGLQSRVNAGTFGDWGEGQRSHFEHPGIVLLDFAPVDVQLKQAAAQRADVLMAVLLNSSQSNTRMSVQVYDVEKRALLWESDPITNRQIQSGRRRGDALDAKFTEVVLAYIDEQIALRDVPQLDEATVGQRLAVLSGSAEDSPLEALIELRYYQLSKLIADEVAVERIAAIVGRENATRLISDDEEERSRAIERFVPESR